MEYNQATKAFFEICRIGGSGSGGEEKENVAKKALYEICKRGGSGDEKEVKKILDKHPSLINEGLDSVDNTVLVLSSLHNLFKIIKLLLSYHNIDINKPDNGGWTALHCASRNGHKDIAELLLSHNYIDINQQNKYGWTALHYASYHGHKEIIELLLSRNNIDIHQLNKDGKLASDICCDVISNQSNKPIILELLKNHSKAYSPLTLSSITTHSKEGTADNPFRLKRQASVKGSKVIDEAKEKELLAVLEERESLKLQVQSLEGKMEEITNNMKAMDERFLQKDKECVELRHQIVRLEDRFEAWMNQIETNINMAVLMRLEEKQRSLMLKPLPLPPNKQTHVFLTHTWREDEKGRNNHDRVGRVNQALRERGLVTWFDSERLEDKIHETISKALYNTCCVLIFVSREYEKKVNSADDSDYCFYEFNIAATDRHLANMRIPIVMDESMLNPVSWDQGLLKAGLGGKLFIDLSSDEKEEFEERCNEVFVRVVKLLNI